MLNNKQKLHCQRGFTLLEIMISLFIFMVIMLGVAAGLIAVQRSNSATVVHDEALRLAEDELNQLRGERFSSAGTSAALNPTAWTAPANLSVGMRGGATTFFRSTQITDLATAVVALKLVEVAVGWNDPFNAGAVMAPTGCNHQTMLSTIIVSRD